VRAHQPVTACPNCGSIELEVYGARTSTHHRGHYAGWTTTTGRFACTSCAAITTVTTRVPPGAPVEIAAGAAAASLDEGGYAQTRQNGWPAGSA
jgi:hypothetical protein